MCVNAEVCIILAIYRKILEMYQKISRIYRKISRKNDDISITHGHLVIFYLISKNDLYRLNQDLTAGFDPKSNPMNIIHF